MPDSFIHADVGPDGHRQRLDSDEVTVGPIKVQRQRVIATNLDRLATGVNPDGSDFSLQTHGAEERAVQRQRSFATSTGRLTLTVAGNIRALFRNPAGSDRTAYLAHIASFSSATGFATFLLNPTTGLPSAVRPRLNSVVNSTNTSAIEFFSDTSATTPLSGGTDTGLVFGLPPNARTKLDFPPLVFPPGFALGINVPFAGAADATMSFYWWEV